MPFKADGTFEPEDASVSKQLTKVLSTGSPLLTRARTGAAQVANRRGLLNSSMAVQAGEAAVLDVALPIASQQAGQIQQSNLAGGQIASTEGLAARGVDANAAGEAFSLLVRSTQLTTNFTREELLSLAAGEAPAVRRFERGQQTAIAQFAGGGGFAGGTRGLA